MDYKRIVPDYGDCCRDESRVLGEAEEIVFPRNTEEIVEAVRYAAEKGWPLTVQGARTGIAAGAVPRGGLVVSTQKMDKLLGVSRDEGGTYYLRVQAGVSLGQIRDFLRRPLPGDDWPEEDRRFCEEINKGPGQWFSPNPTEATASIGGLFATNAQGMNALRYGGVGAHVQALSWVTPRGELWKIRRGEYCFDKTGCLLPGGSWLACATDIPREGVALLHPAPGLDLVDFLAGSEGWAGIAGELELCLGPAPLESWGVVYFFPQDDLAQRFAGLLAEWKEETSDLLSAVEYYDRAALELIGKGKKELTALKALPDIPVNAEAAIYVVLQGDDGEHLEGALEQHLSFFDELGGKDEDSWAAMGAAEMADFDAMRHGLPELVNRRVDEIRLVYPSFHKTASDFKVPANLVADYCAMYHRDVVESGLEGYVFGHILENRIHVNLLACDEEEQARCQRLLEKWAGRVMKDGGLIAGENGLGRLRLSLYEDFVPSRRRAQIREILRQVRR